MITFTMILLLIITSWVLPCTRSILQTIDTYVFYALNSIVGSFNGSLDYTISLLTHSKFDFVMFLIMFVPCLIPGVIFPKKIWHKCMFLLGVMILTLLILTGKNWGIIDRLSPSLALENFNTLPNFGFHTKTMSHDSFPSNHGIIIFTWIIFLNLYSHRKLVKILAFIIGFSLLCPRLIVGAHWLTDSFVGGLSVALIAISAFCLTPLEYYITNLGDKIYRKIFPKK